MRNVNATEKSGNEPWLGWHKKPRHTALAELTDFYIELFVVWLSGENLRREITEGQWPKKRKVSPTRRHKRNRSLKNKEVIEPAAEVSMGECALPFGVSVMLRVDCESVFFESVHITRLEWRSTWGVCLGCNFACDLRLVSRLISRFTFLTFGGSLTSVELKMTLAYFAVLLTGRWRRNLTGFVTNGSQLATA